MIGMERVEMTAPLGSGRPVRVAEPQVDAYVARGFRVVAAPEKKAPAKAPAKKAATRKRAAKKSD